MHPKRRVRSRRREGKEMIKKEGKERKKERRITTHTKTVIAQYLIAYPSKIKPTNNHSTLSFKFNLPTVTYGATFF